MGDLSLALDPHPAPETPAASEALDLSTVDDTRHEQTTSQQSTTTTSASTGATIDGDVPRVSVTVKQQVLPGSASGSGDSATTIRSVLSDDDPSKSKCVLCISLLASLEFEWFTGAHLA